MVIMSLWKEPNIIAILLLALSFTLVISFMLFFKAKSQPAEVRVAGQLFKAEIADSFLSRAKGLMFRSALPPDRGMLFVFGHEDYHSFWMMNTSIPLDIIWIGRDKNIVHIEQNARPCFLNCRAYTPSAKALYVLEINAGLVERYGIKVGDKTEFTL